MNIRHDIRAFIESKSVIKKEKLGFSDDDNFFDLQLVSSLFAMQLVSHLEKTYGVTFEDDDLDIGNVGSINAIVHFIERKSPAQAKTAT